jgi:glycosyltransferase involved in cell wall biosynthesis
LVSHGLSSPDIANQSIMASMRNPSLTVLTTVFNAERYLGQTIESILTQDFTDFEYLIVDDGSTDGTAEILRQWAARDPRIVIERIPQNGGIAKALNRGLALARGRYVGRQDADDLCVGQRLGAQVALLDREPDVVLVSANVRTVDEHGRWIGNSNVENPPALFPYLLNFSNAAAGAGSQGMFRRDVAVSLAGSARN